MKFSTMLPRRAIMFSCKILRTFCFMVPIWSACLMEPPPPIAYSRPPPANACGCWRLQSGYCSCGTLAKCGCPGDCEPSGCVEQRQREGQAKRQQEVTDARAREARRAHQAEEDARKKREEDEAADKIGSPAPAMTAPTMTSSARLRTGAERPAKELAATPAPSQEDTARLAAESVALDETTMAIGAWKLCTDQYGALVDSFNAADAALHNYHQGGGRANPAERVALCFSTLGAVQSIIAKANECIRLHKILIEVSLPPHSARLSKALKDASRADTKEVREKEAIARNLEPICNMLRERLGAESQ